MATPQTYPVLIVGFGYAGRRFAQALRYLGNHGLGSLSLGGVYDVADGARAVAAEIAPVFDDLDEAIAVVRPFATVVAVNEDQHAEVLHRLATHRPPVVVCEKPLTATLAEAEALPREITTTALTVNLVERQSPVLESYLEWAEQQRDLRPLRVNFWWGKHRVGDVRPTMGVLSELIHPIDLVDHLFGFERFELLHVHGLSSDFSPHHDQALDTVTLIAQADDYIVAGSSSFAWPRRARVLTAMLSDAHDRLFRLTIDFDAPHWDCDRLKLERVNAASGHLESLLDVVTANTLFPEELFGVAKIASFLSDSFELARTGRSRHRLADYRQALKVQGVLENLDERLSHDAVSASTILGGARSRLDRAPAAVRETTRPLLPADELV